MKKIILIIFFTLVLTDPFKALDKSFLYQEDVIIDEKYDEIILLKDDCINRIKNSEQYNSPIGTKYFQKNPNDLHDFCSCLVKNVSLKDLTRINNSIEVGKSTDKA